MPSQISFRPLGFMDFLDGNKGGLQRSENFTKYDTVSFSL
jgi:hypothetical protein